MELTSKLSNFQTFFLKIEDNYRKFCTQMYGLGGQSKNVQLYLAPDRNAK